MQYAVLPTKKDPEIPVSARYESPKPARPLMFGRPNISGDAGIFLYYGQGDESFLYQGTNGAVNRSGADGNMNYHILFDASRISNIYGSSNVVQPSSSRFLACIKS